MLSQVDIPLRSYVIACQTAIRRREPFATSSYRKLCINSPLKRPRAIAPAREQQMLAHSSRARLTESQLSDYLHRIKLSEVARERLTQQQLDLHILREIVAAHVQSIPFENLDLMYGPARQKSGGKIKIDAASIFEKLVVQKRGGYCFENNELLALALKSIGFDFYTAAGRVVTDVLSTGQISMTGLEHELLIVYVEGGRWVCDVGQGGTTPTEPVLLAEQPLDPQHTAQKGGSHRVVRGLLGQRASPEDIRPRQPQQEGWYMQKYSSKRQKWHEIYFFTEQEWRAIDYFIPNLFCQTNHNFFSKHLVVALHTPTGRKTIQDTKLRLYDGSQVQEQEVSDDLELRKALEEHFNIVIDST